MFNIIDLLLFPTFQNRIGGVMVSMLASCAVDREFEHRSDQIKDHKIGIFASPLGMQHQGERAKTGWLRIKIMCQKCGNISFPGLLFQ